jgi:ribosomal protein L22
MNISDEALEAAAAAIHSRTSSAQPWREVRQDVRGEYISDAIAALTAAAPHLMAQALNDAADAIDGGGTISRWLRARGRAYRSAGAGE